MICAYVHELLREEYSGGPWVRELTPGTEDSLLTLYPLVLLLVPFTICPHFLSRLRTLSTKVQGPLENVPSGVDDSFLRLEGGASRLMALGWCSGDRTMADMAICCLAVAGVDGCGWSVAFRWAAGERPVRCLLVSRVTQEAQTKWTAPGLSFKDPRPKGHASCQMGNAKDAVNFSDLGHLDWELTGPETQTLN